MYYLVIIQNDTNQVIYVYSDLDEALVAFHNELAYRADGRNKTVCSILNDMGGVIRNEVWIREEQNEE